MYPPTPPLYVSSPKNLTFVYTVYAISWQFILLINTVPIFIVYSNIQRGTKRWRLCSRPFHGGCTMGHSARCHNGIKIKRVVPAHACYQHQGKFHNYFTHSFCNSIISGKAWLFKILAFLNKQCLNVCKMLPKTVLSQFWAFCYQGPFFCGCQWSRVTNETEKRNLHANFLIESTSIKWWDRAV